VYKSTRELFNNYYRKMDLEGFSGFNKAVGVEVGERLDQLTFLVDQVHDRLDSLQNQYRTNSPHQDEVWRLVAEAHARGEFPPENLPIRYWTQEEAQAYSRTTSEARLFAESYYYFAHRVRILLRHWSKPLPYLSGFEARGVRDVRNKLIEHASPEEQVMAMGFQISPDTGPVLGPFIINGHTAPVHDRGLFPNAEEFRNELEKRLLAALEVPAPPESERRIDPEGPADVTIDLGR
jgi:hypothetical protein